MKSLLILTMLMISQLALAQSLKDIKTKDEMVARVETIIKRIDEGREALGKKDPGRACMKIDDIFKLLPDHLVAIGTKMDLIKGKNMRMEHETKMFLIYIHQTNLLCAQGSDNLDLKVTARKLKSMKKSLKDQISRIKKEDTSYENTYNYYYEF